MIFLSFKILCWYWGCQPKVLVFFLAIIIFLFFSLIFSIVFNIIEFSYWKKKTNKILKNQEQILKKMLPLIDLGKISLFSINTLKNPLTILRLILERFKDPEFIKDHGKVEKYLIEANSNLLRIIRNSNTLSWQMCQEEDKRLFNLKEEIKDLLSIYQETAFKNKIKIKLTIDREYRIYADRCHLIRAINILILNAVEALIASDKEKKVLSVSLERKSYLLKIYIKDNAGGINPHLFSSLFKENCFCKNNEKGIGLGLYFANEIMKKYFSRKIQIRSSKNKGTTVALAIKNLFILVEPKIKNKETFIFGRK